MNWNCESESVSQNQKVGAGGTAAIGCYADSRVFMVTGKSVPVAVIQAWDLLSLLPDQQPPAPFLIQTGSADEDFTFCRERFDRIDVTPSHLRS